MKIVFDCERMKYPFTGLFEYCYRLGASLRQVLGNNNRVTYYLPEAQKHLFEGQNVIIQKSYHKLFPPHFEGDILHFNFQLSSYIKGNKHIKKILTIHDLNFLYEDVEPSKREKYMRVLQHNIDKVDYLVAISNYVKQDVLKHLNTHGKPFDVIYNGCDVLSFAGYDNPTYRPERKFVFAIGTILPKKNFHVLPSLLQDNDFELIIAGRGRESYAKKIEEQIEKYGVQDRVRFVGSISDEDKYWYMKNCVAFAQPSLAEGFGIPVIEAMHFGKPCFLSTCTALPEIGGDAAYYFQNFEVDHMRQVFAEGLADYESNSKASYIEQYSSRFSWLKCAEDYLNVYRNLNDL